MVRYTCQKGSQRDAECVCPVDNFLFRESPDNKDMACIPCNYTNCGDSSSSSSDVNHNDDNYVLIRCPGTTTTDVSACVPNVVIPGTVIRTVEEIPVEVVDISSNTTVEEAEPEVEPLDV